jgi:hypothetical protein
MTTQQMEQAAFRLGESEHFAVHIAYARSIAKERDELRAEVERLKADKARILAASNSAVDYVGSANYPERIREAHQKIDDAIKGDK